MNRKAWPMLLAATACVVGISFAPDWERMLHAQTYGVDVPAPGPDQGDSERDRRTIEEQLRPEILRNRRGLFLTIHRDYAVFRDDDDFDSKSRSQKPGFLAGFDYRYNEALTLGWAVGFDVNVVDIDRDGHELQNTTIYTYRTGPYLKYEGRTPWYLYAIALADVQDVHNHRFDVFDDPHSRTLAGQLDLSVGGGYDFVRGPVRFGPVGSLGYRGFWQDGYTEKGDDAAVLDVDDFAIHEVSVRGGGSVTYGFVLPWGAIVPQVRLLGVYDDLFDRGPFVATLAQCGDACEQRVLISQPERLFMELGLSLAVTLPGDWSCAVNYRESFLREDAQESSVALTIRRQF